MYRLKRPLAIANNGICDAHEGLDVTHVETLQVVQQSISATHLPTLIHEAPEMLSLSLSITFGQRSGDIYGL
jgi:hypothetical protein